MLLRIADQNAVLTALAPAVLFMALAFIEIELPGMNMDEVCVDSYVVKMLDGSKTVDRMNYNLPDNILDKNHRFALTGGIHVGLIGAYLGVPFYGLFGLNMFSFRLYHALYGAVTVLLTFLILDRIIGRRIALWGSVLLAVDAGFLLAYRTQGWNVIAPLPLLLAAVLLAIPRDDTPKPISTSRALLIGVLYGLACYGYFVYLLFAPALLAAVVLFGRKRMTLRAALAGVVGCVIGYAPLLYALFSIWRIAPELFSTFIARTGSDLSLTDRAVHVISKLAATLNANLTPLDLAGPHQVPFEHVKAWWWLILALGLPAVWWLKGRSRPTTFLAFCTIMVFGYVAVLPKFGDQIAVHHVAVLLPFMYLLLATMVDVLWNRPEAEQPALKAKFAWAAAIVVAVCGTLLFVPVNLAQHWNTTRQLVRTGGVGCWSNAINVLAADLEMRRRDDKIVFCDWGFMLPCHFLSRGELRHTWDIGATLEEIGPKFAGLFATEPRLTFVISKRTKTILGRMPASQMREVLLSVAEKARFQLVSTQTYMQRDGTPVCETLTFIKNSMEGG